MLRRSASDHRCPAGTGKPAAGPSRSRATPTAHDLHHGPGRWIISFNGEILEESTRNCEIFWLPIGSTAGLSDTCTSPTANVLKPGNGLYPGSPGNSTGAGHCNRLRQITEALACSGHQPILIWASRFRARCDQTGVIRLRVVVPIVGPHCCSVPHTSPGAGPSVGLPRARVLKSI